MVIGMYYWFLQYNKYFTANLVFMVLLVLLQNMWVKPSVEPQTLTKVCVKTFGFTCNCAKVRAHAHKPLQRIKINQ